MSAQDDIAAQFRGDRAIEALTTRIRAWQLIGRLFRAEHGLVICLACRAAVTTKDFPAARHEADCVVPELAAFLRRVAPPV